MSNDKKMKKHFKENRPNSLSRLIAAVVLTCLAVASSPKIFGVVPPPDGGYPGFNTAEGENALKNLSTGVGNAAVGWFSLFSNTDGSFNTAVGAATLLFNVGDQSTGAGTANTAIGTAALLYNTTGTKNTATGALALFSNTDGSFNTAVGTEALNHNTAGNFNTAMGAQALLSNTGTENTATGAWALLNNTAGFANTANGTFALFSNTEGNENTATGEGALHDNTTGDSNTATGSVALVHNTEGNENTATGFQALFLNTTGSGNTADGTFALASNATGNNNTATGFAALQRNTIGDQNTALGTTALFLNDNGIANTAVGYQALLNNSAGGGNTAIGENALLNNTTGIQNVGLGLAAGNAVTTANNVICIGSQVSGVDISNSCFIGNIRGVPTGIGDAISVIIDSNGQLGTISSSRQFKKDIKPMDEASEGILALKPVTFHYKTDKTATPQFGLIAEEVAEVNPDLVAHDKNGEIYTVRYEAVNAMLLNEFLKEHRKVQKLEKGMAALTAQLKKQAVQIQKVRAQVEVNVPATQVASLPAIASRPTVALREEGNNP
jgi:hypothetical protein